MVGIGDELGRYRIVEAIGSGGMGMVFRARDERLQRDVALKVLPSGALADAEARKRFRQEARALSRLNHPHIAVVYDFGEHESVDYLVMEYVAGETLSRKLADGPLAEELVTEFGRQIAEAIQEAHEQGIVHRDLKPGNVMVTPKGTVKVLDFGLARLLQSEVDADAATEPVTEAGAAIGTLPYMSPEQLLGRPVAAQSDIFSAGAVIYEMATGRRPFAETEVPRLIDAILHQRPVPPSTLNDSVSQGLEAVVLRALEKDPSRRHPTAQALAAALEQAGSASKGSRLAAWRVAGGERRLAWAAALGLPILLLGALFLAWIPFPRFSSPPSVEAPEQRPIVAVLPFASLSDDPALARLGVGLTHLLTSSLAGLPSVTMIAPSAILETPEKDRQPARMARRVGANLLVTGTLQSTGGQLHATVNLLRADNSLVWGGVYEGSPGDLTRLQRHLSTVISQVLQPMLRGEDQQRMQASPTASNEALGEYTQAHAFLERPDVPENVDRAIRLFESAVGRDARFALAYAGLGEAFWAKYKETRSAVWIDRARDATLEALRLDPNQAATRYTLALIYQGTGRSDEAVEELRTALRLQPNNDDAHRLIGEILAERGRTDEAAEEFRRAIAIRPEFWVNHRALGLAYFRASRYDEAAEAFQRVTQLQPDLPWGFQTLGLAHHAAGRLEPAVDNYRQAIALGPSPASHSNLGTIYYRQGRFQEAAEMYEAALKLRPSSAATFRNLGDAYRRMGRKADAEAAWLRAVELNRALLRVNPRDARALGMLALCEAKLGRQADAERHAAEAVQAAPQDPEVLYRRVVVYALGGKARQAATLLGKAIELGYSASEAREDDDLASLRHLPEFEALLSKSP